MKEQLIELSGKNRALNQENEKLRKELSAYKSMASDLMIEHSRIRSRVLKSEKVNAVLLTRFSKLLTKALR